MPDARYHYACDNAWWKIHYDAVKAGFKGQSYTINDLESPDRNPDKKFDLIRLNSRHGEGLSKEFIHYGVNGGGNSGFQAVNLAYHLGAKTILLLGFDMFGTHYFGAHPDGLANASPYRSFIKSFESVNPADYGIEIINCSRQTALEHFPRKTLDDVLV